MMIRCIALIVSLLGSGCQLFRVPTAEFEVPIIDAHVHPDFPGGREESSGLEATREEFWREMKAARVSAVLALEPPDGDFAPDVKSPRFFKCVGIGDRPNLKTVDRKLSSPDYRCIKIYLGYTHRFASDPSYEPIYTLARKHRVPVIFHTGDTDSSRAKLKYADPLTIDEVAVDHPDVTFVIAHLGNPWVQSAAEVAFKNPNVVIDLSGLMVGRLIDRERVDRFVTEPVRWAWDYVDDSTKFIYGSDWPVTEMTTYVEAIQRSIPRQHWCDVFYRNAVRVYRLTELGDARCRQP